MAKLAQIGVTGLAVMGRNLARNFARHGHRVALHNRTYAKTASLVEDHGGEGAFVPSETMTDFVASLERPRRVIIMVKAGPATDAVIDELVELMEAGLGMAHLSRDHLWTQQSATSRGRSRDLSKFLSAPPGHRIAPSDAALSA